MFNNEALDFANDVKVKVMEAPREHIPLYQDKFTSDSEFDSPDAHALFSLWLVDRDLASGADLATVEKNLRKGISLSSNQGRCWLLCDETIEFFEELESVKAECLPEFKKGQLVTWLKDVKTTMTTVESKILGGPTYQKIIENERIMSTL